MTSIALQQAWLNGYLEGLKAYSWCKDGTTYVGSCGTTLRDALAIAEREHAPYPYEDENPKEIS